MLASIISAAIIGLMASGGPCTAARAIAGSAFYCGPRGTQSLGAFTCGAFLIDIALVSSIGFFLHALEASAFFYSLAAIASLVAGAWTISRVPTVACSHVFPVDGAGRSPTLVIPVAAGMGGALLLGACCAPFVLAAASTAGASVNPLAISFVYASAHAAVPLAISLWSRQLKNVLVKTGAREALISIEAGIFIACAIYFGVLA